MFAMVLCLLLGSPVRAADADDARARELYENGADLYEEGRYDDAVAAWEESYRLSNKALLLYNIANAEERAGRYSDALEHLNRYRAFATADERAILDRRITNLDRRIQETGGGPTTTTTATTTTPAPPPPDPVVATVTPVSSTTTTTPERNGPPLATFVLGGVGVAGLGVGAIFGLGAVSARSDAEAACVLQGEDNLCPAAAAPYIKKDKLDSLLTDISLGVGAAGIVSAVVFALVDEPISVTPLPGGGLVTVGGRF
jgi:tetratricopeptide (TPR) repeat protein